MLSNNHIIFPLLWDSAAKQVGSLWMKQPSAAISVKDSLTREDTLTDPVLPGLFSHSCSFSTAPDTRIDYRHWTFNTQPKTKQILRLENGAKQLTDANKKQKKGIARPRLLIYSVHASCSASIRLRLYRSTRHIGTVSADTSMSCRFSSSAVSKKDSGGAGFHTSHSTHSLPRAASGPAALLAAAAKRMAAAGTRK